MTHPGGHGEHGQADIPARDVDGDPARLEELLAAVGPNRKPHPARDAASAALKLIAASRPELLLARWDRLAEMLESDNAFTRMSMVHVLAVLAPSADGARWADLLDRFYGHLADSVSVAGHILQVSPTLAAGRPELRARIVAEILRLPERAIPDRLGLLRGYAIRALVEMVPPAELTGDVIAFVVEGTHADSAETRRAAAAALGRWGIPQAVSPRAGGGRSPG